MLLLARAANDAAEPWGFSNLCIVAHPCAGHKKSRKTTASIAWRYGCQRREGPAEGATFPQFRRLMQSEFQTRFNMR